MSQVQIVPFSRLYRADNNVRSTGVGSAAYQAGIKSLASSVHAVGLLQNLVGYEDGDRIAVCAGGRRFDSIAYNIEAGLFDSEWPTPVKILSKEDAVTASLTENVQREAMHPADEFDAFSAHNAMGWTVDRIADVFGVSPLIVERRLKLARVAPALMELYRTNTITTDQLIALCSTDNHDLQVSVWNSLGGQSWSSTPANLRRHVLAQEVEAGKDDRVAFVGGVEAYEAAGGVVRRDLFAADDGQGVILEDSALLERMVGEKLDEHAEELRAQGWGWVDVWHSWDYDALQRHGRAPTVQIEVSEADQAALAEAKAELESVEAGIQKLHDGEGEYSEEESAQLDNLYSRQEALEELLHDLSAKGRGYSAELMAACGAIVGYQAGKARIELGLVRADDRQAVKAVIGEGESIRGGRETNAAGRKTEAMSDALRRSLLGHRNQAAQMATAANHHVAKVLMVCKMVCEMRSQYGSAPCDMTIPMNACAADGTRSHHPITDSEAEPKAQAFEQIGAGLVEALPEDQAELWDALMELDGAALDALLAYSVARSVSLSTEHKGLTGKLLGSLGFDMAAHFTPTADNYLGRVPKELAVEALRQAGRLIDADDKAKLLNMKRKDLAHEAEQRLHGLGWVPEVIRTPAPASEPKKTTKKAAKKSAA